jgi:hypothetical protein
MKIFTLVSALMATAFAAPATLAPSDITLRTLSVLKNFAKCPANRAQPDGKLPKGNSISTSALVPISAKNCDKAYPATEWATVTPKDKCTIFNLELDSDATQGKICNLVFDFPSLIQAPGLFVFDGPGHFTFTGYDINAGAEAGVTTYNHQPRPGPSPPNPPPVIKPGNSYIINGAPCGIPPGIGKVTVSGALCSDDTTLTFKQSDLLCPLGFYVVLTDGGVFTSMSDDPNAGAYTSH